jgi:hypothetical protein
MSATANTAVQAGATLGLHKVLTGSMAAQYGILPLIPLPQEEDLLLKFIRQMGAVLSDKGIYRRDTVVVLVDAELPRMNILEAEVFCSWAQEHVVNYKTRYDKNGEPFTTYKDMPTEIAKKTILSPRFREYVPEIEEVFPIPMWVDDDVDGGMKLLAPGFEAGKFVFEF